MSSTAPINSSKKKLSLPVVLGVIAAGGALGLAIAGLFLKFVA